MNGLEALLGSMGGSDDRDAVYPVGEELAKIRDGFNHIADLKPGEKLRYKKSEIGDYKDRSSAGNDGIFEVFRVLPSFLPGGEGGVKSSVRRSRFYRSFNRGQRENNKRVRLRFPPV